MNLAVVSSINGVPVRLTEERWDHINEAKDLQAYFDDVLEAVRSPEFILRGYKGTLIAVVPFGRLGFLHVVYRELNRNDTESYGEQINREVQSVSRQPESVINGRNQPCRIAGIAVLHQLSARR